MDILLLVVGDSYGEACQELCEAYGVVVNAVNGPPEAFASGQGCFLAVQALTGPGIQLTSVLTVDHGLLVATHAFKAPPWAPVDLEDWCREFSNQLGGRLKNKLLLLGLELHVGLSALFQAPPAPLTGPPVDVRRCALSGKRGWLYGELSTSSALDAWPQVPVDPPQDDALLEGMSVMF